MFVIRYDREVNGKWEQGYKEILTQEELDTWLAEVKLDPAYIIYQLTKVVKGRTGHAGSFRTTDGSLAYKRRK